MAAEHEVSVHAEVVVEVGEDEVCLAPSHWVYRSHVHHSTKVHAAGCCNCRDGQGKKGGAQVSGDWLPFYSLDTAKIAAEKLEPDRNSICNMCLGSYRSLGYLGPRPASPTAVNRLGSG